MRNPKRRVGLIFFFFRDDFHVRAEDLTCNITVDVEEIEVYDEFL